MFLKDLELHQFKNLKQVSVSFSERINLFYGDNGAGKTNLLDAIHLLSFGKSHFHLSDSALTQDGMDFYRLSGAYEDLSSGNSLRVSAKYKRDSRRVFEINGKKIGQVKNLLGKNPLVLVAPDDISLVYGGSLERRDYINRILCQSDKEYLDGLMRYNRILRQKDALLKSDRRPGSLEVEAYNAQLAPLANNLYNIRNEQIEKLNTTIQFHYNALSSNKEEIELVYESQLGNGPALDLYNQMVGQEIAVRRPLIGIQKDDIQILIGGKTFKKFGSQGQVKSLLYAMRMAEYQYLAEFLNRKPILMLDDYFEKLDGNRLTVLLRIINDDSFGQIFLTDIELGRSQKILDTHTIAYQAFQVRDGALVSNS
ncbi:MAG: DNA replication and repair protein RecF [Saprospiraceae bacterium]|jgi:DNA replication and repair protein RecF